MCGYGLKLIIGYQSIYTALMKYYYINVNSDDLFTGNKNIIKILFGFIQASPPKSRGIKTTLKLRLNKQMTGDFSLSHNMIESIDKKVADFYHLISSKLGF